MTIAWNAIDSNNPPATPTLRLIAIGDSFVLGGGCRKRFAYRVMELIAAETSDKAELFVEGINGVGYNYVWPNSGYPYDLIDDLPLRVTPRLATALPVWVFLLAGSNSIVLGSLTGAQVYSNFQTYFAALTSAGVIANHVVVGTMPPRDGMTTGTERGSFNSALVGGAGSLGHRVARLDLDPNIGQDGQNTDSTYYQADTVHWNDAGAVKAARIFKDAMYA